MNREKHPQQAIEAVNLSVEDLTVAEDRAAAVKGGPLEIRELTIKVDVPNP